MGRCGGVSRLRPNRSLEKYQAEVVIDHLAIRPHREIGGDQAGSPFKLSVASIHAPVDGPVLQAGVGARPEIAGAYRAEPQRMTVSEMDRTRFDETGFARDRHLRLKTGAIARHRFKGRLESRVLHDGPAPVVHDLGAGYGVTELWGSDTVPTPTDGVDETPKRSGVDTDQIPPGYYVDVWSCLPP